MAKAKKKLLPKDFETLLDEGDFAKLQAVFDTCDVNARGGVSKRTALSFDRCPDDLARWLVAQGADLGAADAYGNTALHVRARSRRSRFDVLFELGANVHDDGASIGTALHAAADSRNAQSARLLLDHGARVDALNRDGQTPLERALRTCDNADLEHMVALAEVLLGAGAARTPGMQDSVAAIGERFEFMRERFNQEAVAAASAALERLYTLFDVPPVPRRQLHDAQSPIVVAAGAWQEQHQALWTQLVPGTGHAATVQGEIVRISGRIAYELDHNGGCNWDADFRKMADAFAAFVRTGTSLPAADLSDVDAVVHDVKRQSGDPAQLCRFAVAWVRLNPDPVKLEPPTYRR
ncbi:ankyrin repeat domain-containing protein [Burkholderia pyrrocinia]|uniref:ankyrin repeat domain-containing protein n=1 Tax=Burkholderia pyrrocinia TaxID=60550 RepID=UPI0015768846|nr:ankyrin repeat domain-containing protein [Burkholderia pyrrocinia]NTX25749.1 ankyrin repeat domain-containing protein [Burkholderia pyrrocinia]